MGDYVLESNPALERLIERFHAQGEASPPDEGPRSNGDPKRSRRRRSKSHRAAAPIVAQTEPDAAGAASFETEQEAVDGDLWTIRDDLQPVDELLLIDFTEEPAVFDEVAIDDDEDETDDTDEVLDLYGDEDWEVEEEDVDADEVLGDGVHQRATNTLADARADDVFDDERWLIDGDQEPDDEDNGDLTEYHREGGDWIFNAFEVWKRDFLASEVVIVP